jgi:hypothetical protein
MCQVWESECLFVVPCKAVGMSVAFTCCGCHASLPVGLEVCFGFETTTSRFQEEQFLDVADQS